jgi:hypothetical protein
MMRTKIHAVLVWMLLLFVDGFVVYGLAESWTRLFVPVKNIKWTLDKRIGVRFRPNQQTYGHVQTGYKNVFVTNSLGLHDVERSRSKSADVYRIQIFGDSLISNAGVPISGTIPSCLEQALRSKGLVNVEVMNMASGDDGTPSQALTYEDLGRQFHPDVVICYFMNDFSDNVVELHERTYSPYFELTTRGTLSLIAPRDKDTSGLWERFKEESLLYRAIANKVLESKAYNDILAIGRDSVPSEHTSGTSPRGYAEFRKEVAVKKALPVTLELIKHFRDVVNRDGGRFIVVDGERFHPRDVGTVFTNKDFEKFCKRSSIDYLAAFAKYAEFERSPGWFLNDHHLTAAGNREVGRFLAEKLYDYLTSSPPTNGSLVSPLTR